MVCKYKRARRVRIDEFRFYCSLKNKWLPEYACEDCKERVSE